MSRGLHWFCLPCAYFSFAMSHWLQFFTFTPGTSLFMVTTDFCSQYNTVGYFSSIPLWSVSGFWCWYLFIWNSDLDLCDTDMLSFLLTLLRILGFLFPFLKSLPCLGLSLDFNVLYKKLLNVNFIFKSGPIQTSGVHTVLVAFFLCHEVTECQRGSQFVLCLGQGGKEWGLKETDSLWVPAMFQC